MLWLVDSVIIGGRCLSCSALGSVCRAAHLLLSKGGTRLHPFDQIVANQESGSNSHGDGKKALHGVVGCWCQYRGATPSVAVADVPVAGLDLRGREGEGATLSECLTVGGRPCHHGTVLLSVSCHDGGEIDGLSHGGCLN